MPFPPRTEASDAIARALFDILLANNAGRGGANRRMVCVVVTGDGVDAPAEIFVATSGNPVGGGMIGQLAGPAANGLHFQNAHIFNADNLANPRLAPAGGGAPAQYQLPQPPQQPNAPSWLIAGGRHCAEPKALYAASQSRYAISGLSTIWWGNNANPYPVAVGQQPDPTGANPAGLFADPCDVCQTNERYIMAHVQQQRSTRGGGRRAVESPI